MESFTMENSERLGVNTTGYTKTEAGWHLTIDLERGAEAYFSTAVQELIDDQTQLAFLKRVIDHPTTTIKTIHQFSLEEIAEIRASMQELLDDPSVPETKKNKTRKDMESLGRPLKIRGSLPQHRITQNG